MSMTKTGIIGLVVLIVILIGGYSIVTQTGNVGPLGENATTTDETAGGNENTENEEATTATDEGQNESETEGVDDNADDAGANTDEADTMNDTENEAETTTGIGGMGDWMSGVSGDGGGYNIPMEIYADEDLDLAFKFPKTWDIEENEDVADGQVVVGDDFAGGMKAEMTVTVHNDATIELEGFDEDGGVVFGKRYEIELECKADDLDCVGGAFIIPVEGEMTEDGFEGKVIEVEFGIFEMPDYDGPDTGVDVNELMGVTASTFASVAGSINAGAAASGAMSMAGGAGMTGGIVAT